MSQPKKRFGRSRAPQEDTRKYSLTDEHRQLAELAAENLPRNRAAEAFAKSAARTGSTTAAKAERETAPGQAESGEAAEDDQKARKAARREQRRAARQARAGAAGSRADQPTPLWYKVVMIGLMIVGLLWIIVYYLFQGTLPIPGLNLWNLVLGLAFMLVGLIMTTRWR